MKNFDHDLWQRLETHQIDPPQADLSFADRLARENLWSQDHAKRVIREYKRFCYLARTTAKDEHVTPSDAVDQAWHLHLTYSRDYWDVFCPKVLCAPFHHGPTAGGRVERARYYDQYAATLKAYEKAFDEPPPADIWPDAQRRFGIDPHAVRIHPADFIILNKAVALLWAFGLLGLGAVCGVLTGVLF